MMAGSEPEPKKAGTDCVVQSVIITEKTQHINTDYLHSLDNNCGEYEHSGSHL
jgi:hypothetical protein